MTEWDALSMLIRRKVLISSSHVIFRRCTHFHILSWDTFSFWAKYDLCYVCCLVLKCWHLGALPGLVESQYCFSFAASALLRSSSAEPEPISQFANLPICQFEEHRVAIFATDQDWYRENTATKEGTPRFKIGVTVETLMWCSGTGCCFFCQRNEVTRLFQKNGHDEMRTHNVRPRQGTVGTSGTPWENFWPRWQNTFHGPRFRWCLVGPPPISVWLMGLVSIWSKERCLELIRF